MDNRPDRDRPSRQSDFETMQPVRLQKALPVSTKKATTTTNFMSKLKKMTMAAKPTKSQEPAPKNKIVEAMIE